MDQRRIWDYFQGPGIESFAVAQPRLDFLARRAARLLAAGERVLNIGTGDGWIEREIQRRGFEAYALDPSAIALRRVAEHGVPGAMGVIDRVPFRDGSFALVFCAEVLEHLTEPQLVGGLAEILRILRPGGTLIGTVPFNEALETGKVVCPDCGKVFHRWGHLRSFDAPSLRLCLDGTGFEQVKISRQSFPYFPRRSLSSTLKRIAVRALGRLGVQAAFPALAFLAAKPGQDRTAG